MAKSNVDIWKFDHGDGVISNEPHEGQKKILESSARFKIVVCGRRWGKSMLAVIILLLAALSKPGVYWYLAPTYKQAHSIAWRFLLSRIKLFPKSFQDACRINRNELTIELPNGSIIELKGVQESDNLVGSGLSGVVLDEYAVDVYGRKPVWKEAIRPSLSDRVGWAVIISTPRGYNHFYDLFEYAESSGDPEWEAFRMPSSTNPWLTKKELDAAKREIGEELFAQEYEADFKKRSGLVYKEFDREVHTIEQSDVISMVNPKWTLEVGVDFGSAHPTAGIFVLFDPIHDIAYVVDEWYEPEKTIAQNAAGMKAIEDKWLGLLRHKAPTVRWGDSQGKQEILEYFQVGYALTGTLKGADSVEVGISEVRKRLATDLILQKPKLFVCKNCKNTIMEFENYSWLGYGDEQIEIDPKMRLANKRKDAPKKIFDDAMDALRYVIQYHTMSAGQRVFHSTRPRKNPLAGI